MRCIIANIKGKGVFKKNVALDYFDLKQKAKTKLTYKSSDETVATVDANGTVKAKASLTFNGSETLFYIIPQMKAKASFM